MGNPTSTKRSASPIASRDPHVAPATELVPAHWVLRVYAAGLDTAIVLALSTPVVVAMVLSGAVNPPVFEGGVSTEFVFWTSCVVTLFIVLYPTVWIARNDGQTVGKRLFGVRVVTNDGSRIGPLHAAYREVLVKQLVFGFATAFTFGLVQLVNVLWPLVDRRNRFLHDIVSLTRVVDATQGVGLR